MHVMTVFRCKSIFICLLPFPPFSLLVNSSLWSSHIRPHFPQISMRLLTRASMLKISELSLYSHHLLQSYMCQCVGTHTHTTTRGHTYTQQQQHMDRHNITHALAQNSSVLHKRKIYILLYLIVHTLKYVYMYFPCILTFTFLFFSFNNTFWKAL